jgi:RNA polymerase sigma-70 factor (ECF subfamily)
MTEQAAHGDGIQAGTPKDQAIPALLDEHGGKMYRLGLRLCGNHADAQDLLQETFLQAYRKWHQFEGRSRVTTWLYTIAARQCKRMHRRRAGQPERMDSLQELLPFGEPLMSVLPDTSYHPARDAGRNELRERIEDAVGQLPVSFRMPLILKDIVELSIEEIAAILGLKRDTVKTRVHRARLKLRQVLSDQLPRREGPPPAYSIRICLDLLQAKQEALDRGAAFPVGQDIICERCMSVFQALELGKEICREIGEGGLPEDVRQVLTSQIDAEKRTRN